MPIRPAPFTCTCPKCRWSQTVAPRGDALLPGDVPLHCPACGHEQLTVAPASVVSSALAAGVQALKRLWQRSN